MADFSKQWCDINDPDMPWDFDIREEFDKLRKNSYVSIICEGFGLVAIGNVEDECYLCMMNDDTGTWTWVNYNTFCIKNGIV